jgi:hypothetical protein
MYVFFSASRRLTHAADDRTPHEAVNPNALSREEIDEVIAMRKMQRMTIQAQ